MRTPVVAVAAALTLFLGACGQADAADPSPDEPVSGDASSGACPMENPSCVDTVSEPVDLDVEAARAGADGLLGVTEEELVADVRVSRRGDERFMLTEDYVLGRMTIELDPAFSDILENIEDPRLIAHTGSAADLPTTAGINGNNSVENEGWMVSVDWHVTDTITLRSITADREDYTESVIDFDSLAVPDFDAPVIYDNEQFSQEFQMLWNTDRWNLVLGYYYLDSEAANDFDVVLGLLAPGGITAYTGGVIDTEGVERNADAADRRDHRRTR